MTELLKWVLYLVGGFVGLVLFLRLYNTYINPFRGKSKALSRWAKGIAFSSSQLTAMRSLWQWYKTNKPPINDPLVGLSTQELSDLLAKCELSYLPRRFRVANEERQREELIQELQLRGMNGVESQIVAGMYFGKFGAANDL